MTASCAAGDVPPADASVLDLFLALVAIPSPSGRERTVGEFISAWLAQHGVSAAFDAAGAASESDAGNLVATLPGHPDSPSLLFVAHMDTVESGAQPVHPRRDGDRILSDGNTILGADNKSAVAALMRACAVLAAVPEARRPTVTAAFTCREESGRMGVSLLDLGRPVDCAFCVDGSRPVGTVITRALGQAVYTYEVEGRAAHAAAAPESGIDAIRVVAEIVAALPLGRREDGGSASVAAMIGGPLIDRLAAPAEAHDCDDVVRSALLATPTNSIAQRALLRGEVRGYTVDGIERALHEVQETVVGACSRHGAAHRRLGDMGRMVPPYPGDPGSRALALARSAIEGLPGVTFAAEEAHATLEANYLASSTDVVAIASGGSDPHRTSESIDVAELERLEALLLAIAAAAASGQAGRLSDAR